MSSMYPKVLQALAAALATSADLGESEPLRTATIGDALYVRFSLNSPRLKIAIAPAGAGDVSVELTLIHPEHGVIDTNRSIYGRAGATDLRADVEVYAAIWEL